MGAFMGGSANPVNTHNEVWDTSGLAWVVMTQPLIKTDTLSVNADITDRAARLVGKVETNSNVPDTLVSGDITTATPGAGNTVEITFGGHKSCSVTISGTWTGTLVVESNIDAGSTWVICWLQSIAATSSYATLRPINSFTANGAYTIYNTTGVTKYRVRATAFTGGGAATCKMTATESPPAAIFSTSAITDIIGRMSRMRLSPMGALKVAIPTRLAGQTIAGAVVDPAFWGSTIVGTGAVTQNYGVMTLTTAATANSSMLVTSQRIARYTGAVPNYFRSNLSLPAVTTGTAGFVNKRRWGAFDAANGYFFEATQTNPASAPTLSVVCRKTDGSGLVDTPVTSFNGDYGATFTLDVNVHSYEIWWTNKNAYFWVDDALLHTVTTTTTPAVATPHLKIGLQTINSGDCTGVNTLVVRSATINRLGVSNTEPLWAYISGDAAQYNLKYGPGKLHKMIFNNTTGTSITFYDAAAGTTNPIALITTATASIGSWDFNINFYNGLTAVTVANNLNATVIYE